MTQAITIRTIGVKEVEDFFKKERVNEPNYLFPTYDTLTIKHTYNAAYRIIYGAYTGLELVGYCMVYTPKNNLDLIYVSNKHRGIGVAAALIKAASVKTVTVFERNTKAISVYKKAGLEIDLVKAM